MGRTKGAINKQIKIPEAYILSAEERVQLIAGLLIDIISEELCAKS